MSAIDAFLSLWRTSFTTPATAAPATPQPAPKRRRHQPTEFRPAACCGRRVAHTKDGRAYLHRCDVPPLEPTDSTPEPEA